MSKYIFLVLYVADILLTTNYMTYRLRQKRYCLAIFYMKDLRETSYVLGIQILRDRPSGILRLSQQTYIEGILKKVQYAIMFF